jgi:YidC/Oxa1 family membrane protein insertase
VERRIVLFLSLSIAVLIGNYFLQAWIRGPLPDVAQQNAAKQQDKKATAKKDGRPETAKKEAPAAGDQKKGGEAGGDQTKSDEPAEDEKPPAENVPPVVDKQPEDKQPEEQYFSIGSADPNSPYRMVATLTNRGAALERVELNGPRYLALSRRNGYLGYLAPADSAGGAKVRVVPAGTPADKAGLRAGDVITQIGDTPISSAAEFVMALEDTKPDNQLEIAVRRGDETKKLSATLTRVPLQLIRPERDTDPLWVVKPRNHDPLSMLVTLGSVDDARLGEEDVELPGVKLRTATWEGRQIDERTLEFERVVPKYNLKVVKRYRLAQVDPELDDTQPAYHIDFTVEVHNLAEKPREVAYQLDGPNGLPVEGWWYMNRISTEWSALGTRDVAMRFEGNPATLISSVKIAGGDLDPPFRKELAEAPLVYAGDDSQYFSAVLLPQRDGPKVWLSQIGAIRVGDVPEDARHKKLTNVSVRLLSQPWHLDPGASKSHTYRLFVGPKKPALLAQYGSDSTSLTNLIYFGWSIWGVVATFLTKVLHAFYAVVGNYGLAIIMLTVVVRLCMFPLSRKQALSAQKMQELQPEMKKINEKFKGNNEGRARAMQDLWKKHNYNPMGGCLLAFVQLPIFIGLYRALMIDVELRGAPLFSEAIRWCSDLSAPDMLFYWGNWSPHALFGETGWLGPYFNVLPLFTVALFLVQQRMFMPPPADEQAAMQQKIMTYMMVFMGVMFYKVASGLCLYFIASSLWGIGERKLLPKLIAKQANSSSANPPTRNTPALATSTGNGAGKTATARKKNRPRK